MYPFDYRTNLKSATRIFLPILRSLKLRKKSEERVIYIKDFHDLNFLNIRYFVLTLKTAKMDKASGTFFCRVSGDLVDCYIILNSDLYDSENLESVKVSGVHEFCHFLAIVYSATATSIQIQREHLLERLSQKSHELNLDILNKFLSALSAEKGRENTELYDDDHFRLDCEGNTVNYGLLFKNLLFSQETFEKYFDSDKQKQFCELLASNAKNAPVDALNFYEKFVKMAAKEKSVPYPIAFRQSVQWVLSYLPN